MNIILIGFMCTGKDAAGKLLAKELGMEFVNTDDLIVEKEGRPIPDIFKDCGEIYFRNAESQILEELLGTKGSVISTGGGIVTRKENRGILKKLGRVILLKATPEVINSRLKRLSERPLLNIMDKELRISKIKELLGSRDLMYTEASDYAIDTSNMTIEEVVREIIKNEQNSS